jgi:hypothetical protein
MYRRNLFPTAIVESVGHRPRLISTCRSPTQKIFCSFSLEETKCFLLNLKSIFCFFRLMNVESSLENPGLVFYRQKMSRYEFFILAMKLVGFLTKISSSAIELKHKLPAASAPPLIPMSPMSTPFKTHAKNSFPFMLSPT